MSDNSTETIKFAQALIQEASVTPDDLNCQQMLKDRLEPLGFKSEQLNFEEVTNLWVRKGDSDPVLCFAGHTDVVPTGPEYQWQFPPFAATIEEGHIHGRGAADMKGSIAAFVTATTRFIEKYPNHKGSIAYLITSDEEGPAKNGTVKVVEALEARNEKMTWCLVGEPSSTHQLGDVIKNGRRGSLNAKLTIRGKQGHVAYPHLADNPVHRACSAFAELPQMEWDQGNEFFPATTFQITNFHCGTGATNVIPGEGEVLFNFRYCTEVTDELLRATTEAPLQKHGLQYDIEWNLSGQPFLTEAGPLVDAAVASIKEVKGIVTELSTSGGTSDGRFIAPTGAQVLELGPLNATIHQVNEHVSVQDLNDLSDIYERILVKLLAPNV